MEQIQSLVGGKSVVVRSIENTKALLMVSSFISGGIFGKNGTNILFNKWRNFL
jgi:hypothetical protein